MRMVQALLIDPYACVCRVVDVTAGDLAAYYRLLAQETRVAQAESVTLGIPWLAPRDELLVDLHGALQPATRWFEPVGSEQPFAGKGLIIGSDRFGRTISPITSLETVQARTTFLAYVGERYLIPTREPWTQPEPVT